MSAGEVLKLATDFLKEYGTLVYVAIGVLAIPFGGYALFTRKFWRKVRDLWRTDIREIKRQNQELEQKLERVREAFDADNEIWLRRPIEKANYDRDVRNSIPIMLVANLKGGVGKTTIAANLAAYFEARHGERVLAIDLDHQGSLSSMLLPEVRSRNERTADAVKALVGGRETADFILSKSASIRNFGPDSRIIDCDDPFANFETQVLLKWLIGDSTDDIRYHLARTLHGERIQKEFDRIIIDAPPRITTGFVNALCASTHLVVPFVLDILSAERVGLFLGMVQRMHGELFPRLKLAGVVGTMKGNNAQDLRDAEKKAIDEAKRQVQRFEWHASLVLEDALIPRRQSIADAAGQHIAYHQSQDARIIFDRLGAALFDRTRAELQTQSRPRSSVAADPLRRGVRHESGLADSPTA